MGESGNKTAMLAQDVSLVYFVTSTFCSSWPQKYLGEGKCLTQNYLVGKLLRNLIQSALKV